MELICDRVGIIDNGMIVENKTMDELQHTINSKLQISVKVDYPNYAGKILYDNFKNTTVFCVGNRVIIEAQEKDIPKITALLINKGISVYGVSSINKNLEEIFLEIVNKGKQQKIL